MEILRPGTVKARVTGCGDSAGDNDLSLKSQSRAGRN